MSGLLSRTEWSVFISIIIIIIPIPYESEFFTPVLAGCLSLESEWQQDSRTLLSILYDLNNAVVWMVSILPPIFSGSNPLSIPLGTISCAPTTIGITIIYTFHNYFSSLARKASIWFFFFTLWSAGMAKSTRWQVLSFFFISTRSSLLARITYPFVFPLSFLDTYSLY